MASVYLDILLEGDHIFPRKFVDFIRFCKRNKHQLILSLNSNAHSYLWGLDSNPRGEAIEELMAEFGLELGNIGFESTFEARGTKTTIDIMLLLHTAIDDWRVTDKLSMSDHRPICFHTQTRGWQKLVSAHRQFCQTLAKAKKAAWQKHIWVSVNKLYTF